jgi:predicted nucleic acid-binding protein
MVMMVADPVFVDTNVLVYATVAEAPLHEAAQQAIETLEQSGADLWISRQILREYLATLTRPQNFTTPITIATLVAQIQAFELQFQLAEDNTAITQNLLTLVEQIAIGGRQIHDANIVATMQSYGILRLLTHNIADFARFAHLITVIPLVTTP